MTPDQQTIHFQNLRIEALKEALRLSEMENEDLRDKLYPKRTVQIIDINDPAFNEPIKITEYGVSKTS